MAFEDIMGKVQGWAMGTEALAALGAKLALAQDGAPAAPPEITGALDAVIEAAGLGEVDDLVAPQRQVLLAIVRLYERQMADLLDDPARAPGWRFTDPDILDGWGRGSTMVPAMIAGAAPELGAVASFLDVGTGVGLLACAAATVWPNATIVGIDRWEPSLERARSNVSRAQLDDRITLRHQEVGSLDDRDAYDCIWVPTFFLSEAELDAALPRIVEAAQPGGWIVLGRMRTPPDPLAQALAAFRTVRSGGHDLEPKRAAALLSAAGCTVVDAAPAAPFTPLELVLGRRPA